MDGFEEEKGRCQVKTAAPTPPTIKLPITGRSSVQKPTGAGTPQEQQLAEPINGNLPSTQKRVVKRRKHVQRDADSYRPKRTSSVPIYTKTMRLVVPASGPLGTDEEFGQILEFAKTLPDAVEQVTVIAIGIEQAEFFVTLTLQGARDDSDDKLLSNFFRTLEPFHETNPLLLRGFTGNPPHYEFRIGDDFIAEKGYFG